MRRDCEGRDRFFFTAPGGIAGAVRGFAPALRETLRTLVPALRRLSRRRAARAGLAAAALAVLGAAVFTGRRPVILLEDRPFILLYGENRALFRRLALSLVLFRPVLTVEIAAGAGPDTAARAAAARSRRPRAVFFPYRYREGARRYLAERPGFPVFILGGRNPPDRPPSGAVPGAAGPEPRWVCTDTRTDELRAGVLAERSGARVVRSREDFAAAGPDTPLILFTWQDPALVPRKTLAVFDDAPWTQIGPALKLPEAADRGPERGPLSPEGLIPSEMLLFWGRGERKMSDLELKSLKTLKYNEGNTDN
ncbi:MAG: hypothetical protein LBD09_00395 [Treponema sp.]|jgi:hypothetical protein|nr:hypothetical protein [Treponema sp.]